jgi:hypothetical protein
MVRALSQGMLDPKFMKSLRTSAASLECEVSLSTLFAGPVNRMVDVLDLVQTVYEHTCEVSDQDQREKEGLRQAVERLRLLIGPLQGIDEKLLRFTELLEVHECVTGLDLALAG